jgi:hypothetical protein
VGSYTFARTSLGLGPPTPIYMYLGLQVYATTSPVCHLLLTGYIDLQQTKMRNFDLVNAFLPVCHSAFLSPASIPCNYWPFSIAFLPNPPNTPPNLGLIQAFSLSGLYSMYPVQQILSSPKTRFKSSLKPQRKFVLYANLTHPMLTWDGFPSSSKWVLMATSSSKKLESSGR